MIRPGDNRDYILEQQIFEFSNSLNKNLINSLKDKMEETIKSKNIDKLKRALSNVPKVSLDKITKMAQGEQRDFNKNLSIAKKEVSKIKDMPEKIQKIASIGLAYQASIKGDSSHIKKAIEITKNKTIGDEWKEKGLYWWFFILLLFILGPVGLIIFLVLINLESSE